MKKKYKKPVCISTETTSTAKNVCGWFTLCGKQVSYRS